MRRLATSIVVVGVLLLGVLAAADALRGHEDVKPAPAMQAKAKPPTLKETLNRQHIAGILVYSDRRCRLHSLFLPAMTDEIVRSEQDGPVRFCSFSDAGGRYTRAGVVESPGGGEVASCLRGRITVRDSDSRRRLLNVPGCAPAWDPDGRLTLARGEQVLEGRRVLYSRAELHRIARHDPNVAGLGEGIPFRVRVLAVAWLDRIRLAMSLHVQIQGVEPQDVVVLLDGDNILALSASFQGALRNLLVSPAGTFVADDQGTVIRRSGHIYNLPNGVPRPRSVAFSPDEGWLALATGRGVFLVGTARNLGRIIRLPVPARHLIWEPGGVTVTSKAAG